MTRRWFGALLLALALLASQAAGLRHAVLHGTPAASAAAADDGSGHLPGSVLCHLLDHLGLAAGAPAASPSLPAAPAVSHVAPVWRATAAPQSQAIRPYAARAPPALV